jgi:hypothetical protein
MQTTTRGAFIRIGFVACATSLGVLVGTPVQAQAVRASDPDHVSVSAAGVPLVDLLVELAAVTPMDLEVEPAVGREPVTIELEDVYVEIAIRDVIEASGADSVIAGLYRSDVTLPIRVTVGDAARVVTVATGASAPRRTNQGAPAPFAASAADSVASKDTDAFDSLAGGGSLGGGGSVPQETEGNATPEELMAAFAPGTPKRQRSGPVMLPFTNPDGSPMIVQVEPGPKTTAVLPIADEAGNPVVVPLAPPRIDGQLMLPFTNPDGTPMMVPGPAADPGVQTSPVPGVVPGDPPR